MRRWPNFIAWLLAAWALLLPGIAAAHELEHSHEEGSLEHVLCACAAFGDRDDDAVLGSSPAILVPPRLSRDRQHRLADDLVAPSLRVARAIRAPPAA